MLALVLGLKTSLPLVLAPSLASNAAVMLGAGPLGPAVRRFWPMLATAPLGVALGAAMLGSVDGATAGAALGIALIGWCGFSLARPDRRLPPGWEAPLRPGAGLLTGVVNGLTGSQVLPVAPFVMSLEMPRKMMIQTLNLSFTLSSLAMGAALARLGILTWAAAWTSLAGVALAVGGVKVGEALRRRLPERAFRVGVLAVLSAAGAALVLRGL